MVKAAEAMKATEPPAPMTLHDYPPYVEQSRIVRGLELQKAHAEESLQAACRMARDGAANREARVLALAAGQEPPPILPEDNGPIERAREALDHVREALYRASDRLRAIEGEFASRCLNEARDDRLEALRDQDAALEALADAIGRQAAIQAALRARGASTSGVGWYAPVSLRDIASFRQALADCARQLGAAL
jgi:hypothetical protein